MNIDCFLKRYADILMNDKNDNIFESLKLFTDGTTSHRIAKLLNFAVSQMADSECYVEVGVYTGATLCSANYRNEKTAVGIDNYKAESVEFSGIGNNNNLEVRDRCLYNIKCLTRNTKLIEKDFREVTKEEIGKPVAVSFIDGKHDFIDVTKNLEWLEPLLSDWAILIFDDVNYQEVSKAIFDWLKNHPEHYDLISYEKPFYANTVGISSIGERFLNNGEAIVLYHKEPFSMIGFVSVEQESNKIKGNN